MTPRPLTVLLCLLSCFGSAAAAQGTPAPPPPTPQSATPAMGWNSWDSFGTTATEKDIRDAADVMSKSLKSFGWQYVTLDMEWFVSNPVPGGNNNDGIRSLDSFGRFIPAPNRFPSAASGAGLKPLADYVHARGLRFGLHILAGIPRQSLVTNSPIEGSDFHALDAADTHGTCGWNPDYFDVLPNAAGQAYYDSIARLYAGWGVDLIKVDCITQPRYRPDELRTLRTALNKTGRPMLLSLSPGEPPIEFAGELAASSDQWRISNDIWDIWHGTANYPQGVGDQFARTAYWRRTQSPGHWPDADMLPLGYLGPAPGFGEARQCRLNHAEQRTQMTLWSIFRSPLLFGGNLTKLDAWTLSLLTNREVIELDQHSHNNRPVLTTEDLVAWRATPDSGEGEYLAVFNLRDEPREVHLGWAQLGIAAAPRSAHDMWTGADDHVGSALEVKLEPHGSALLRLR